MFVPSYLFLDFVFVLFPTLGWRRSQHSLVWTPTSSHQYLLKAQSKPAAPAGIWFSKEVLMQPLHPHTPGIGRRPVSTALGLTGEDLPSHSPHGHTSTASTFLRSMLSICSENFFTSSKPSTSLIFKVGSTSLYFYPRKTRKSCWAGGLYGEGWICIIISWVLSLVKTDVLKELVWFTIWFTTFSHLCLSSFFTP